MGLVGPKASESHQGENPREGPRPFCAQKRAILIDVIPPEKTVEESRQEIEEMCHLVETYGGIVIEKILQKRGRPSSKTYLGTGKAEEAAKIAKDLKVDMAIFNGFLKPHHAQNLGRLFSYNSDDPRPEARIPIWDRTDTILKIFEKHARSQIAKLQIKLAQLKTQIPKIYQYHEKLFDRERGGISGTRGSGEKGIETEKRHIREQIKEVERKLEQFKTVQKNQHDRRKREGFKTVALVGYTNAGKSSLLAALTKKEAFVRDELFSTLDTSIGTMWIADENNPGRGQKILIADTIGFIQNLPPHLIESFKATLAELTEADLILHIIDCSDPHQQMKIRVVEKILSELVDKKRPILRVYNKSDQQHFCFQEQRPWPAVSALTKTNLEELRALISHAI